MRDDEGAYDFDPADVARALQLEELQTTHAVALETFEVSALKGTDVDQPRNLAKSVTVE